MLQALTLIPNSTYKETGSHLLISVFLMLQSSLAIIHQLIHPQQLVVFQVSIVNTLSLLWMELLSYMDVIHVTLATRVNLSSLILIMFLTNVL